MSSEYKVSIICAVFNHEKYLRKAFDSFLSQKTDFKFEIVVTDDASTDSSAQIIREYTEKYPDIFKPIYFTENQYSRHVPIVPAYSIPAARGEYLAFCEGDDYWTDDDKLQIQVEWLDAHPDYSACVHNTMNLYCDTGKEKPYNTRFNEDRDLSFADVVNGIGGVFHTSATVGRAELYKSLPEFAMISERNGVGDLPRALWLTMNGKIRFINRFMSVYRINSTPSAWTSKLRNNNFLVERLTATVGMYKGAREFVTGADAELLAEAITNYEWELLQANGNYADMKSGKYKSITRSKSLKQRLWLDFKQYFPGLYCLYMKCRGMESGIPERLRKASK